MPNQSSQAPRWSAQVRGDASVSLARDFKALSVNIAQCKACQGRWFTVSCMAEACHRFMAPRFVSTLVFFVVVLMAMAVMA